MRANKIVMHYKNGRITKGSTNDFLPDKKAFRVHLLNGRTKKVDMEDLKAVFFVKDMAGNKAHQYKYKDLIAGGGKKIQVNFRDGETVIGYVLGYSPEPAGFMMTPADAKGNNERIFIVKSATKSIKSLGREEKRRYHRAKTRNLITYDCIEAGGMSSEHGMGKTLDIGQGGILVETANPISCRFVLLTTADSKEEVIHIKGEVVYSRRQSPDTFHSGIHFLESTEKIRRIVVEMVKTFLQTKQGP